MLFRYIFFNCMNMIFHDQVIITSRNVLVRTAGNAVKIRKRPPHHFETASF